MNFQKLKTINELVKKVGELEEILKSHSFEKEIFSINKEIIFEGTSLKTITMKVDRKLIEPILQEYLSKELAELKQLGYEDN
jgi:hypothetical protein